MGDEYVAGVLQILFLQKDQDEVQKDFDDVEWLQDVPEYLAAEEGRYVHGVGWQLDLVGAEGPLQPPGLRPHYTAQMPQPPGGRR